MYVCQRFESLNTANKYLIVKQHSKYFKCVSNIYKTTFIYVHIFQPVTKIKRQVDELSENSLIKYVSRDMPPSRDIRTHILLSLLTNSTGARLVE